MFLLLFDVGVSLVGLATYCGLTPHIETTLVTEVNLAQCHEQLRSGGV